MKITGAATVLPVSNVDASIRFFTEVLGFNRDFRFGDYAGVERENCLIHLSLHSNPNTGIPGSGGVYVFCDQVDTYHKMLKDRGATIDGEPKDYPYGMRDFVVIDPDGNKVSFGCPTQKA